MRLAACVVASGLTASTHAFAPLRSQRFGAVSQWRPAETAMMAKNGVLVVGSVNADIVVSIPRLPAPGETLLGSGGQVLPGGKGANQAVAAGRLAPRLGCAVQFCGVFGSDVHAPMLRSTMLAAGVDLSLCFESQGPTGQAVILLQPGGENSIVLVPAANADWPQGWEATVLPAVAQAAVVLLQREIPDAINVAVAVHARQHGVTVILDLGGDDAPPPKELLANVDYVAPNETELQRLVNLPTSTEAQVGVAAATLQREAGVPCVLVTVGAGGSVLFGPSEVATPLRQPCFPAPCVVDTTGAGDCFRGAFAAALAGGRGLRVGSPKAGPKDALEVGAAAAAHCVTVLGAMVSMPTPEQAEAVLNHANRVKV